MAHPILDREWVRAWELEAEKELGIELVNPFYDSAERGEIAKLDAGAVHSTYDRELDAKAVVEGDLGDVAKADGTLAILTNNFTIGTYMELFYNSYNLHKPAYVIVPDAHKAQHPWLRYMATKIFLSPEEFKTWWKSGGAVEK